MNRPVAFSALILAGILTASASADTGRTKTLTLAQLKGFRVWEQRPSGYAPSSIPGNIRRSFTVRFKNEPAPRSRRSTCGFGCARARARPT